LTKSQSTGNQLKDELEALKEEIKRNKIEYENLSSKISTYESRIKELQTDLKEGIEFTCECDDLVSYYHFYRKRN